MSSDPAWTPRERWFFGLSLAAGLGWSAFIMLASPGWSLDDELAHYLRSRSVWENPPLIFDSWTRIGRNLFHFLPAHFGLTATRVWTLAFAGLAVVLTTLLARRFGLRRAWLIPILVCFQPWFAELSWGVLTQTPFMLTLIGGILALASGRLALSGLCFGFLPLVRHEGIALTGLWGLLLVVRTIALRSSWLQLILAALASALPLTLSNFAAWWCTGAIPCSVFLSVKPTEIYGHGTLWHFISISIFPAGVFTLALATIGLPETCRAWRVSWPLIFFPAYFALHSVVFWKGLFASAGYYHFLMPMAPGLAILALFGVNFLLESRASQPRRAAVVLLGGMVLQGLLMLHFWQGFSSPRLTLPRDPIIADLDAALDWQKRERPVAPVVCHHVYAAFREDWIETPARRRLDALSAPDLSPGCLVFWEAKYADVTGLPLTSLQDPAHWRELEELPSGRVRIFEKVR